MEIVVAAALTVGLVPRAVAADIRHVIHVSVDGLRGDLLRDLLDYQPGGFAAFERLRAEGAVTFNARCDHDNSTTLPNHTSMLTGLPLQAPAAAAPWQQHGYVINHTVPGDTLHTQGYPPEYKPSVFDVVHDRGGKTLLLASKDKFLIFDESYNATHGAPDLVGEDHGRDKIDFALVQYGDSSTLAAVLIARMSESFPSYTFLHLLDPDIAGHLHGWGSLAWQFAVKHADSVLGLILSALQLRPHLQASTALVITADHGGGVPSWTHTDPEPRENYTIPVMIWGPGLPRGVKAESLFANRHDPGITRPLNDADPAPLRNGDTGNIALALLGLPPIPGSWYLPRWAGHLQLDRWTEGSLVCSWPTFWAGWSLETNDSLDPASWTPVTRPPVPLAGFWYHRNPLTPGAQQFYRLRGPE